MAVMQYLANVTKNVDPMVVLHAVLVSRMHVQLHVQHRS